MTGKVGADVTPEEAQKAAKLIALNLLSSLKEEIGDLDKVRLFLLPSFPPSFLHFSPSFHSVPPSVYFSQKRFTAS